MIAPAALTPGAHSVLGRLHASATLCRHFSPIWLQSGTTKGTIATPPTTLLAQLSQFGGSAQNVAAGSRPFSHAQMLCRSLPDRSVVSAGMRPQVNPNKYKHAPKLAPMTILCFLSRYGWVLSSQPQSLTGCPNLSLLCSFIIQKVCCTKCASWVPPRLHVQSTVLQLLFAFVVFACL